MKWLMILFLIITPQASLLGSNRDSLIKNTLIIKRFDSNFEKIKIKSHVKTIYNQWYRNRKSLRNIHNPAIPVALTISESGLNSRAISRAGCIGLFQLDPKTAIYTCKKYGIKYNKYKIKAQLLNDVNFNTLVGLYVLNEELGASRGMMNGILSYKCGRSNIANRMFIPNRYKVLYARYLELYNKLS